MADAKGLDHCRSRPRLGRRDRRRTTNRRGHKPTPRPSSCSDLHYRGALDCAGRAAWRRLARGVGLELMKLICRNLHSQLYRVRTTTWSSTAHGSSSAGVAAGDGISGEKGNEIWGRPKCLVSGAVRYSYATGEGQSNSRSLGSLVLGATRFLQRIGYRPRKRGEKGGASRIRQPTFSVTVRVPCALASWAEV